MKQDQGVGRLSTHVLDTTNGKPAAGITIDLFFVMSDSRQHLASFTTNEDGRTDAPLLTDDLEVGVFELVFHIGEYFASLDLPDPKFLDTVPIRFGIADKTQTYHVPLLVSPWSYSTYRGS